MRLVIVGDMHGSVQGAEAAERFADNENADAIVQLGDFHLYQHDFSVPCYWLRGNHEDWSVIGRHRNGQYSLGDNQHFVDDFETLDFDGAAFGFVGGIQRTEWHRSHRAAMGRDDRMWVRPYGDEGHDYAGELAGSDVLLFHDSPFLAHDSGEHILRRLVREVSPELCVHGHWHEYHEEYVNGTHCVSLPPCDTGTYPMTRGRYVSPGHTVYVVYDTDDEDYRVVDLR